MQRRTAVLTIIAALMLGLGTRQVAPLWASVFGDVPVSSSATAAERLRETLITLGTTNPADMTDAELVEMLDYIIHGSSDDHGVLCPDAPECISSDPYCFYGAPEKDADGCIVGCGPMACQGSAAPGGTAGAAPQSSNTPAASGMYDVTVHSTDSCWGFEFTCRVPNGCFPVFARSTYGSSCILDCGTVDCPDNEEETCLTIPDDCPRGGDCAYPETRYSQTDPMCAIDCGEPTYCVDANGCLDIDWEQECIADKGCWFEGERYDHNACRVDCGRQICPEQEEYTCLAPNDCPALRNGCSYTQKEYAPNNPNCLISCGEPECDDGGTLECPPEPECVADDGCWFEDELRDANGCLFACGQQVCPDTEEEDDWWDDLLNWDDWFEQADDEEHDEGDDEWIEGE